MKIIKKTKPKCYSIEKGNFKNHQLDGKGIRIDYHDKKLTRIDSIYKGEFKNGQRHGRGLFWLFPNNFYHEGVLATA